MRACVRACVRACMRACAGLWRMIPCEQKGKVTWGTTISGVYKVIN